MRFLIMLPLLFLLSNSALSAYYTDTFYRYKLTFGSGEWIHNTDPNQVCNQIEQAYQDEYDSDEWNGYKTYLTGVTLGGDSKYRCKFKQVYNYETEDRTFSIILAQRNACPLGQHHAHDGNWCEEIPPKVCEYELGYKKDLFFDHMLPATGSRLCRDDCEFTIGSGDGSHSVDICTGGGVCISTAHVTAQDCDNVTDEPIKWECPSGWSQHNNVCLPPVGEDPDPFEPDPEPDPDPDPDPEPDPGTGGGDTGGGDTGGGNTGGGTGGGGSGGGAGDSGGGNTGGGNTGGGNTGGGNAGGGNAGGGDAGGGGAGGGDAGGGDGGGGRTGGGAAGG